MTTPTVAATAESSTPTRAAPRDTATGLANASLVASVCDQYRGQETVVLDVTGITALFDYFVITTASNRRQMHALADEAARALKRQGERPPAREGYEGSSWIVEDFGDVILHVFTPETRSLYDLENLWGDAIPVDWTQHVP